MGRVPIQIQKSRVQEARRFDATHRCEERLFQVRMLLFEFREPVSKPAANRAGLLRTAAGDHRRAERMRVILGQVLRYKNERPDQPKLTLA